MEGQQALPEVGPGRGPHSHERRVLVHQVHALTAGGKAGTSGVAGHSTSRSPPPSKSFGHHGAITADWSQTEFMYCLRDQV